MKCSIRPSIPVRTMASAGSSDRTAITNTHTHVKKRDILRIDCFICDLVFVPERGVYTAAPDDRSCEMIPLVAKRRTALAEAAIGESAHFPGARRPIIAGRAVARL